MDRKYATQDPDVAVEDAVDPAPPKPRLAPRYVVIVDNDDDHSFDYVVLGFMKIFKYPLEKCTQLALQIHEEGRAVVWTGVLEQAEFKCDQIRSLGPDFHAVKKVDYPLAAYVEPLA